MRILLCISTLKSGGAEKNISILANLLIKKNYDVTIMTFDKKKSKSFFYLDKKIKIINLNLIKKSNNIFSSLQNFITRVRLIRNLVYKGKFQYFISYINTMNITMLISTIFLDIKKIISDRNNPYHSRNTVLVKILKILFYKNADQLIIQTKASKKYYWFLKKKNISVINNFFDKHFHIKKQYKLGKKIKIIVVSKIEKQKGIKLILNSLKMIKDKYDLQCDIYGKGSLYLDIKNKIVQNKLSNSICLKKTQNLKKVYKKYDLYILSSYYEGYPNSLVEAMIVGLPVISSSCDYGPKEIISNKVNGILFKVGSQLDLIKKIELLINNYTLATKLGKKAKYFYNPNTINNQNFKKWLKIIK